MAEQRTDGEELIDTEQLITDFSQGVAISPKGLRMPSLQSHPTLARTPSHLLAEDLSAEEEGVLITEVQHEVERVEDGGSDTDFIDDPAEGEARRLDGAEYDTDLENEGNMNTMLLQISLPNLKHATSRTFY